MITDITTLNHNQALEVFTLKNGLDPYLNEVRNEVDFFLSSFDGNVKTAKGKAAITAMVTKIAKVKVSWDAIGKDQVDRMKELPKLVDIERKRMRDILDAWKVEVRKPLTDWEDSEKSRIEDIRARIERFSATPDKDLNSDQLRDRIAKVLAIDVSVGFYELTANAEAAKGRTLTILHQLLTCAQENEEKLAKVEAERLEREAKAQVEREAALIREVEERVEKEAQAKIDRARNAEIEARMKVAQAEREKIAAVERIKRQDEEHQAKIAKAILAETDRIETARIEEEKKHIERALNKTHRERIKLEAVNSLVDCGISQGIAQEIIALIEDNFVSHVLINF